MGIEEEIQAELRARQQRKEKFQSDQLAEARSNQDSLDALQADLRAELVEYWAVLQKYRATSSSSSRRRPSALCTIGPFIFDAAGQLKKRNRDRTFSNLQGEDYVEFFKSRQLEVVEGVLMVLSRYGEDPVRFKKTPVREYLRSYVISESADTKTRTPPKPPVYERPKENVMVWDYLYGAWIVFFAAVVGIMGGGMIGGFFGLLGPFLLIGGIAGATIGVIMARRETRERISSARRSR